MTTAAITLTKNNNTVYCVILRNSLNLILLVNQFNLLVCEIFDQIRDDLVNLCLQSPSSSLSTKEESSKSINNYNQYNQVMFILIDVIRIFNQTRFDFSDFLFKVTI